MDYSCTLLTCSTLYWYLWVCLVHLFYCSDVFYWSTCHPFFFFFLPVDITVHAFFSASCAALNRLDNVSWGTFGRISLGVYNCGIVGNTNFQNTVTLLPKWRYRWHSHWQPASFHESLPKACYYQTLILPVQWLCSSIPFISSYLLFSLLFPFFFLFPSPFLPFLPPFFFLSWYFPGSLDLYTSEWTWNELVHSMK